MSFWSESIRDLQLAAQWVPDHTLGGATVYGVKGSMILGWTGQIWDWMAGDGTHWTTYGADQELFNGESYVDAEIYKPRERESTILKVGIIGSLIILVILFIRKKRKS